MGGLCGDVLRGLEEPGGRFRATADPEPEPVGHHSFVVPAA
nr:MAG TPA_asm: hypothetical protein [Caudoviricetes sp.]